jgi:hypothetical protein
MRISAPIVIGFIIVVILPPIIILLLLYYILSFLYSNYIVVSSLESITISDSAPVLP